MAGIEATTSTFSKVKGAGETVSEAIYDAESKLIRKAKTSFDMCVDVYPETIVSYMVISGVGEVE